MTLIRHNHKFTALLAGLCLLFTARPVHASGSTTLVVIDIVLFPVMFPWLIADAVHQHHHLNGCIYASGTGFMVRSDGSNRDYALTGDLTGISAGDYVKADGHAHKDASKHLRFEVRKALSIKANSACLANAANAPN
jgi:hypothetical protein